MDNFDNGGYAFPIPNADFQTFAPKTVEEYKRVQSGMTLRDYFAAKALGLCYAQYLNKAEVDGFQEGWRDGVAKDAYLMAEAMLRVRE